MRPDGSDLQNVTDNPATDMWASWSSAGRIAFMSNRDGNNDIYVMNADGSAVQRLTNGAGKNSYPCGRRTENGSRIAQTVRANGRST